MTTDKTGGHVSLLLHVSRVRSTKRDAERLERTFKLHDFDKVRIVKVEPGCYLVHGVATTIQLAAFASEEAREEQRK